MSVPREINKALSQTVLISYDQDCEAMYKTWQLGPSFLLSKINIVDSDHHSAKQK